MAKKKRKTQHKTQHKKIKTKHHEPNKKNGVILGALEE